MRVAAMLAALLMSGAAHADSFDGWYVGAGLTAQSKMETSRGEHPDPALAIFAGYNWQRGPLVVGVETHARFDTNWRASDEFIWPTASFVHENRFPASADLRVRLGYAVGSTQLYGRAGIGLAKAEWQGVFVLDDPWSGYSRRVHPDDETMHIMTLGAGVEQNFRRMFVRGDVGGRWFADYGDLGQYEATAAFGLRF